MFHYFKDCINANDCFKEHGEQSKRSTKAFCRSSLWCRLLCRGGQQTTNDTRCLAPGHQLFGLQVSDRLGIGFTLPNYHWRTSAPWLSLETYFALMQFRNSMCQAFIPGLAAERIWMTGLALLWLCDCCLIEVKYASPFSLDADHSVQMYSRW